MSSELPAECLTLNTTFDSPLLHMLALAAAKRCADGDVFDALTAVILSYSAFEGFLNEMAQLAQTLVRGRQIEDAGGHPLLWADDTSIAPNIQALALALRVAQDQRASVEYRYDLSWEILSGAPIERGEGSRQNLGVLGKLRNALVHVKSEETQIYVDPDPSSAPDDFKGVWLGMVTERHQEPPFLRALESQRLLATGDHRQPWIHRVCTRNIADWACMTVEQLAANVVALIPAESAFRQRLQEQSLSGTIDRRGPVLPEARVR
jgi:hypothetical protein